MNLQTKNHLFLETALWYIRAGDSAELHGFMRGLTIALEYSKEPEIAKELIDFLGFVDEFTYKHSGNGMSYEELSITASDLWKHGIKAFPEK